MSVVVIGFIVFDVKLYPQRALLPGHNIPAAIYMTPGGPSRNIAEALGRMAQPTTLLGVVGDDLAADVVLDATARAGVAVGQVRRVPGGQTYTYAALTTGDHAEPYIVTAGGIQAHLDAAYLFSVGETLRGASALILHADLIGLFQSVRERLALPQNLPVGFTTKYEDATPELRAALPGIDWLFLNHREAARLWQRPVESIPQAAEAARWLLAQGVTLAVITRGAEGFVAATPERILHMPAYRVEAVDPIGAGDSLTAGFVAEWLASGDLGRAAQVGAAAAALTVASPHTPPPDLSRAAVEELMTAQPVQPVLLS